MASKTKTAELQQLLTQENIDILTIQETKLNSTNKTPQFPHYSAIRKDRTSKSGGGLLTNVKDNITFTDAPPPPTTSTNLIETQAIKINISTNHMLTISINYIPPRNPSTNTQSEDDAITDLLIHLTDTPNSVITGDFNAHSNQWHSPITDHEGDHIASIIQSSSYSILNRNSHTRIPPNQNQQPTSPDITTISSNLLNKTQWETKTALHSDHLPILITITITENFRLQQTPKTFTNYKKAKWTGFKEEIEQALSNTPASDNVHTSNKLLTNLILTADKHHIPKGQVKTRNSIPPAPIRDLIKTRNNLRRKKPTDPNLKQLNDDITKRISDQKRT